jgi:ribosome maturation factor RimP
VRSAVAGNGSLIGLATAQLGIQPLHYWDFTTNRALFAGADVGAVTATPGWSFTRATVGSAEDLAGNIVQFASGEIRRTDRGLLIEGARTNLFLNSATGGTQSVTVAAVAHTLSFRGTGTITLTGTSTAGPLVGSGANTRVTLTFTPTAGSLTLTISGSCTNVQLEEGAFVSSWIPTAGTSVVRNAEVLSVSSPGVAFPLSLFVEFERASDSGAGSVFFDVNDNTNNERATLQVSGGDLPTATMVDGGAVQSNISIGSALAVGAVAKLSGRFATNDAQAARGGVLGTADTVATLPTTPTFIRFGDIASGGVPAWGYIRRAAIFNAALTDAQLQRATA